MDPRTPVVQTVIAQERAGQQPGVCQDVKTVAAPEDQAALVGEPGDLSHDRRESGDRAGPEVVAMGEASRQDHAIGGLEVGLLVPEGAGFLLQDVYDDMM